MSQNEEENVLTSANLTNSIANESSSSPMTDYDLQELLSYKPMSTMTDYDLQELSSYRPMSTMTDHDPRELSSYRPMPTDNGPQLSSVTWLMPIDLDQRRSTSTMMQLPLGHDPQLQSSSRWPMTYEPNQQPMTPSHHAVHTNNYHRQMQLMPPMNANGGIPSTLMPWIGSIGPHDPSFLHRECCTFNPNAYYNGASSALRQQERRGVEQMQFENSGLQGFQSMQQQQRGDEQNMQLVEPRVQGLWSLQQQRRGVEQMQFEDSGLQGSQSMQQQQRGDEQNMQLAEPRVQGLWSLQQQQQRRGVEQMQFEDSGLQGSQSMQQQQRGDEQNMQLVEPRVQGLWSLQQQQQQQHRRGVEQMQFEDPRSLQGSQSVAQLQFPADRIHAVGRRQRPWTLFFQRPMNATIGRTMPLECRQLNGTVRYCATCNALWPANGQPPATHGENNSCKLSALLPDKCVPLFECHVCNVRMRMEDISEHVATAYHDAVPDKDGEHYMSFFCGDCNRVLYAPLRVFVKHRQSLHSTADLDVSVPSRLYVMYSLMQDFVRNGRDVMLYACLSCMHMSPYSCNRRRGPSRCAVCAQPDNRFYCQHCNVVFYALQAGYDMHRFTFEHFYFMYHRWVRSNAVIQPVNAGNTGGGRGRGGGRCRGRASARAARGRAVGDGVASASEQS